jgi:hypothetical protein
MEPSDSLNSNGLSDGDVSIYDVLLVYFVFADGRENFSVAL